MISLLGLLACSNQPVAPALPDTPTLPNSVETPKAPQSATNIMRIQDIDFGSYSRDLAKWVGLELGESDQTVTPKIESYFSPQGGSVDDAMDSQRLKTETEFSTFGVQYTVSDRKYVKEVLPIIKQHFDKILPAATMVIADMVDPEGKIEIEVTAFRG